MVSKPDHLVTIPEVQHTWRFNHKNGIAWFVLCTVVVSILATFFLFGCQILNSGFSTESLDEYEVDGLVFYPGYQGEMWLEGEQLHFYMWLVVNDTRGYYDQIVVDDVRAEFVQGLASIRSTQLPNGINELQFAVGIVVSQTIEVYADIEGMWVAPLRSLGTTLTLLFFVSAPWLVVPYFWVMEPLRREKMKARFYVEQADFGATPKDVKLLYLVERTDKVRESLTETAEKLEEKRRNLITVVGLLLTGLVTFLTLSGPLNLGPSVSYVLNGSLLAGLILLLLPANRLLSTVKYEPRPRTVWSYHGNVSEVSDSVDTFEADLHRYYSSITYYKDKEFYRDNLREIVYLYYVISKSKSDYEVAVTQLKLPIFVIVAGFSLWMTVNVGLLPVLSLLYLIFAPILLLAAILQVLGGWITEDFILTRYALFYDPDKIDESHNCNIDFDRVEELLGPKGVIPYVTKWYNDEQLEKIRSEVREILKLGGQNPDEAVLFGPQTGSFDWCGKEIPVMIVARSGKTPSYEVHPKKKAGECVTIYSVIESLS